MYAVLLPVSLPSHTRITELFLERIAFSILLSEVFARYVKTNVVLVLVVLVPLWCESLLPVACSTSVDGNRVTGSVGRPFECTPNAC